ncbi:RNA 3'-terminal phosphate cyclase-like [Oscarella lobularis]|uniref:RNA 3'-terminal phosphate cyclase-like n=1 Tax=Oscarella lobularis TaxID=121494 RepID=UPI003313B1F1
MDIDGSVLEGGGQILRIAIALAAVLQKPINVVRIRANRSNPGLRPQHLAGLQLVADLCSGKAVGNRVGSQKCSLSPGSLQGERYVADTKTAGSVVLLLQAALPCCLFGRGDFRLVLRGGTNATMAPQIDYTLPVFKPIAEKFGVRFDCTVAKRGFYPRGGGEVIVDASPVSKLKAVCLTERGRLVKITGRAFVAGKLSVEIADRMKESAVKILRRKYEDIPVDVKVVKETSETSFGDGTGIILVGETSSGCLLAGSGLGEKGVRAEEVGREAADSLISNLDSGGCVDEYLQDQLIIFMALAEGRSTVRTGKVTLHTETAIYIVESLTGVKFDIVTVDEALEISCQGMGFQRETS